MKIYVSHSREFDFTNELYAPLKEASFSDHIFFFSHENGRDVDTRTEIQNSDLVLAEVSFPSTGQGIELGWADILHIPIVCISKEGSKLSSSLNHLTKDFTVYLNTSELISKLKAFLN